VSLPPWLESAIQDADALGSLAGRVGVCFAQK
jgi:hypothetical protein